jgi:hypothetical protein
MTPLAYPALALTGLLLATATTFEAQRTPTRVTITKHFTPADQVSGRYQYVPFDLPKGVSRLHVSYTYDKAEGENVVDLGLFEPGPLDLGTRAFRGYSGGARSDAWIDKTGAAPGYREGFMPPGRWHALLGLYRVAPAGVDVTLTIEWETGGVVPFVDYEALRPPSASPAERWYTGALHTHTIHSDGTVAPGELLRLFREKGFDFVAITDHNNTTHTQSLRRDVAEPKEARPLLRILGEEVTTPGGHANVWGLPEGGWVDFRVPAGSPRIRDLVAAARKEGAMFSINHPASECLACGWTHEVVDGIEAIEISNGRHGEVANAMAIWDKLLVAGRRITGVGSSDWHSAPNPIDNAHVRVHASSLTQENILAAIRAGRVIVMTDARDATPEFTVRAVGGSATFGESLPIAGAAHVEVDVKAPGAPGGRLVIVTNGQRAAPLALDAEGRVRAEAAALPGYIRFELLRADGSAAAYTNPVYLVR